MKFSRAFDDLLDEDTVLSNWEKLLIRKGYLHLLREAESENSYSTVVLRILSHFVTIGSTLVASIMALGRFAADDSNALFWFNWILSITVVVANKIIYTSEVQKRALVSDALVHKYASEGRKFISMSDRYTGLSTDHATRLFCERVEIISQKGNGNGSSATQTPESLAQDIISASPNTADIA